MGSGLSYSGRSGSCLDALDAKLRRMIQQVRDILPQVTVSAVINAIGKVRKQGGVGNGLSYSGRSGSCLDALDAELRRMIQQVRDVLPQVTVSAVINDLVKRKKRGEGVGSGLSYSGRSGSCLDALDAELRRMIQQVRDVLPHVPVSAVKE